MSEKLKQIDKVLSEIEDLAVFCTVENNAMIIAKAGDLRMAIAKESTDV